MRKSALLPLGTISEGTLKSEDLVDALAYSLKQLRLTRDERRIVNEALRYDSDNDDGLVASELVGELTMIAECHTPAYSYYGSLEGDGACFGVWEDVDSLEEAARNGDVLRCDSVPPGYRGEVMLVTDHGNVTYGYVNGRGRFVEVWSVV